MKDSRTYAVIGAAMEVHWGLGSGFLEPVYQEALQRELTLRGIPYAREPRIDILYKGEILSKKYQPDFVCFETVIVELKALSKLSSTEEAQLLNYLKAANLETGLLLNFGTQSLEYRRLVRTRSLPK